MIEDLRTFYRKDPALYGAHVVEVLLYPGLWALWAHRMSHLLYRWRIPLLPRLVSQVMRLLTGIEIHPGASVGRRLFIDHGMGVVIGETANIGDDVTLYHQVTLGARGWWADGKGRKRHPTIGDRVVVGVGATVLGPVSVGNDARIGAQAVVLDDVPPGARVHSPRAEVTAAPTEHPLNGERPALFEYPPAAARTTGPDGVPDGAPSGGQETGRLLAGAAPLSKGHR